MSGLKPITVNTAPEADPHIYAEDDAAIYQSIFGSDGVMTIGQQCASQVISNNKVRVKDGVIIVGGHVARIPYGEYIDCEIANGQSGVNRNDIIIAKFVTTGSGGIDTYTCEVKQGVAGSSASDPALTQNDLYAGGKIREMPLYRVKIEGLSIVAVEQLFKLVPTIPELEEQLAELNSKSLDISLDDMRERTGETNIPESGYTVEQDCYVRFVAMFKNTNGFCLAYVKDSSDNIVYAIRINAPNETAYAQTTSVYPCKKGWKIQLSNYVNVVDYYPKFVLTY